MLESGQLLALARHSLSAGKPFSFYATGTSMWPTLRHGDQLQVLPCHSHDLRRGDLLCLATDSGTLRVHRLVRFVHRSAEPELITRGDALPQEDPPIHPSQVLGRVVAYERRGRRTDLTTFSSRLLGWLWALFPLPLRLLIRVVHFFKRHLSGHSADTLAPN